MSPTSHPHNEEGGTGLAHRRLEQRGAVAFTAMGVAVVGDRAGLSWQLSVGQVPAGDPGIAASAKVAEQASPNCIERVCCRATGNSVLTSKSRTAWETAAKCATLAEEAVDSEEREYFIRMRDAWTTLAKRCEDFNLSDVTEK